jgi:ribosome-interacting GTPase 1
MTHAKPEVAEYPFTTQQPVPGMMNFKGVQVQLVDLPAVSEEHMEHWVMDNIRGADGVLVVIDLTADDPLEQVKETLSILENFHIKVYPANEDEEIERDWGSRPGIIVANKSDVEGAMEMLDLIREMEELPLPVIPASAETGDNLRKLEDAILDELKIIRIYSKVPHQEPDMEVPFAIREGSTLMDFAVAVHKEVAAGLKSARVWGSTKFEGQTVPRDYILQDGDIVELHT